MNRIRWTRKATKQLMKLPPKVRSNVYEATSALAAMPDVQNVKALKHHHHGYRLRVGSYRVLFDWDGAIKVVSIEEVKKRDERTY